MDMAGCYTTQAVVNVCVSLHTLVRSVSCVAMVTMEIPGKVWHTCMCLLECDIPAVGGFGY